MAGIVKKLSQLAVTVDEVDEEPVDRTGSPTIKVPESHFSRLPVELREMIYAYLVPDTDVPIVGRVHYRPFIFRKDRTACSPQFLLANRQIYQEMVNQFYSMATFAMYVEQ